VIRDDAFQGLLNNYPDLARRLLAHLAKTIAAKGED
jgi:hypothetical protein